MASNGLTATCTVQKRLAKGSSASHAVGGLQRPLPHPPWPQGSTAPPGVEGAAAGAGVHLRRPVGWNPAARLKVRRGKPVVSQAVTMVKLNPPGDVHGKDDKDKEEEAKVEIYPMLDGDISIASSRPYCHPPVPPSLAFNGADTGTDCFIERLHPSFLRASLPIVISRTASVARTRRRPLTYSLYCRIDQPSVRASMSRLGLAWKTCCLLWWNWTCLHTWCEYAKDVVNDRDAVVPVSSHMKLSPSFI